MISYNESQKHNKLNTYYDVMTNDEINAHQNEKLESEGEIKKMGYNANNAAEGKGSNLPKDEILVGVIANIEDGVVKQFIPESAVEGWKGDVSSHAINLQLDVTFEKDGNKVVEKLTQMFTYILEGEKTIYSARSNLGKYKKKYEKLPEVGDQVKVITDEHGFGKIKIE